MTTRDAGSFPPSPPASGTVPDAFEMMRKMWGMAGMSSLPGMPSAGDVTQQMAQMAKGMQPMLPSLMVPTFDVKELDKRIADLRAVEQWLQLNASMLRATIQALEVQRATVDTLRQFGDAMFSPVSTEGGAAAKANAFPESQRSSPRAPSSVDARLAARAAARKPPSPSASAAAPGAAAPSAPLDPAAWWNTLQEQFTQIAAAAAAGASGGSTQAKGSRKRSPRG